MLLLSQNSLLTDGNIAIPRFSFNFFRTIRTLFKCIPPRNNGTRGGEKAQMLITILTAARNASEVIRGCLESVAGQELPARTEVEHLVLDGASTDGTVEILEDWVSGGERRRYWTGKDGGFYEALNKGLERAQGEVIGLLNADDRYYDRHVLARVTESLEPHATIIGFPTDVDGCYGDLVYEDAGGQMKRYWKSGELTAGGFRWGWMPPHPTVYVRKSIYEICGGFRTDLGSAADYEWMLRAMVKHQIRMAYIPKIQVAMRIGGMSNRSLNARFQANAADRKSWEVNGLRPLPWTFVAKPLRKIPQWWQRPVE